ncbi:hypothetical protein BaRGS_00000231 [Batillaria attramentaria]|uniref:G-protein coupled receptors family 1 profile domain-containing protein n=1 Tax=Batillaria attramentaria TaxID=370345 RepID=A0ABD0MBP2_9CAEN
MSTELGQDFNNSQIRNDTDVMLLLNRLMSEEYFAMVWPHVLLLVVVMVLGIPGNALVIAVFFKIQRKKRYNSTQLLVIALAFADLVVCCLLIPFDIHRLRFYYSVKVSWLAR